MPSPERPPQMLTISPCLDGGLGGGAGVQAEVLGLEAGAVQRWLRSAAVDLGQGASQQLDGGQDLWRGGLDCSEKPIHLSQS